MVDYQKKLKNLYKFIVYFLVVFVIYLIGRFTGQRVPLYEFIIPIVILAIAVVFYRQWLKRKILKTQQKEERNSPPIEDDS